MTRDELLNRLEPLVDEYMLFSGKPTDIAYYFSKQDWYSKEYTVIHITFILLHLVRLRLKVYVPTNTKVRMTILDRHLNKILGSELLDQTLTRIGI